MAAASQLRRPGETEDDPIPPEPAATSSRARAGWRAVTPRGRATLLVTVLALALGLLTGWREWIGVSAGLAVLLLVAGVTSIGRSSCAVEFDLPRHRFVVGEPGAASMRIRNTSNRRMLPLRMELEVGGLAVSVPVPSLHGGAGHLVDIELPTARRAVVDLGPLRAVRGDVFGLIRRVVQWPVHRQVFVHPRTVRPANSLPGFVRDLEGQESTKRTASDLSFHTLREYVPGDDRRFIHWKSTARNGSLQVREFLQTHRSQIAVVLSGSRSDYHVVDGSNPGRQSAPPDATDLPRSDGVTAAGTEDEFEIAVSCAASIVAELVRQRRDVVTDAAGAEVRGVTADGVLDQFCPVQAAPEAPDLVFRTRQLIRRNPRVSLVVLIFGSTVSAAQIRAAFRFCPPSARVLELRVRSADSPQSARITGSDASRVVTVGDVDELPAALRAAG